MSVRTRSAPTCITTDCYEAPAPTHDTMCIPHKIEELKSIMKKRKLVSVVTGRKKYAFACSDEDCDNAAFIGGKCARHSGKWNCKFEGCTKLRQGGGLCKAHGGKHKNSVCKHEGCEKFNQGGGFCRPHGGGPKCKYDGCTKHAPAKIGFCTGHIETLTTNELVNSIFI